MDEQPKHSIYSNTEEITLRFDGWPYIEISEIETENKIGNVIASFIYSLNQKKPDSYSFHLEGENQMWRISFVSVPLLDRDVVKKLCNDLAGIFPGKVRIKVKTATFDVRDFDGP